MAIPVIEGTTANTSGGSTATSLTLTKPSGVVSGDLLLIMVMSDHNLAEDGWTTHTDFTRFVSVQSASSDCNLACFWKLSDGTEASTEVMAHTSADELLGWYLRISGVDQTTPINVTGSEVIVASDTDVLITEVTTDIDDCLVFAPFAFDGGDVFSFFATNTGWSLTEEGTSGTTGNDASGGFCTKSLASQGVSVDVTVLNIATTSDGWSAIQFAIAPTGAAGTTMVAASGSFTLTGAAATTSRTHILGAVFGSFTLTGTAATTAKGATMTADAGSFTLTGADATTLFDHVLAAISGSFTLTGADATTTDSGEAEVLIAVSGSFTLTGKDATTTDSGAAAAGFVPHEGLLVSVGKLMN